VTAEAALRERHIETQESVVGGHGGACRCSCGAHGFDPDLGCPRLEEELEALHHARFDDDGGPARD
jgi:hypothetical protein